MRGEQGKGKKAHDSNETGVRVGPGLLPEIAIVGVEKNGYKILQRYGDGNGQGESPIGKRTGEAALKPLFIAVVCSNAAGKSVVMGMGEGIGHIVE